MVGSRHSSYVAHDPSPGNDTAHFLDRFFFPFQLTSLMNPLQAGLEAKSSLRDVSGDLSPRHFQIL